MDKSTQFYGLMFLIALLILSGLFYTLRTGFAQGRLLGDMVALITGKLSSLRDGEKKVAGQVTGFQAFCIAVASHVGTGNLAGVAIAVAIWWTWCIILDVGYSSFRWSNKYDWKYFGTNL